jgi:hypothetical protein
LNISRAKIEKQIAHFKQQGALLGIHSYQAPTRTRIITPPTGTKRAAEETDVGQRRRAEEVQGTAKILKPKVYEEVFAPEPSPPEPFAPRSDLDFAYTAAEEIAPINTELFRTGVGKAAAELRETYKRASSQIPGEERTVGEEGDPYGVSDKVGTWLRSKPTEAAVRKKLKQLAATQKRAQKNLDKSADWIQVKHQALSLNKKQVSEFKTLLRAITKRGDIGAAKKLKQKYFKQLKDKFTGKEWPDEDWSVELPRGWGGTTVHNNQQWDRFGLKTQIQNIYRKLDKHRGRTAKIPDQSYLAVFEAIGAPRSFLKTYRQIVDDIHGDHTRNEKRFTENTEAGIELQNYLDGVDPDLELMSVKPLKKKQPRKGVHISNVQKARAAARKAEEPMDARDLERKAKRRKARASRAPKTKPKAPAAPKPKPKAPAAPKPTEAPRTIALYNPQIYDRPVRRRAAGETPTKRRALNKPRGPSMWRSVGSDGPFGKGTRETGTGRFIPIGFTKGADGRLKPIRRTRKHE